VQAFVVRLSVCVAEKVPSALRVRKRMLYFVPHWSEPSLIEVAVTSSTVAVGAAATAAATITAKAQMNSVRRRFIGSLSESRESRSAAV
jgi:hypothetical protein